MVGELNGIGEDEGSAPRKMGCHFGWDAPVGGGRGGGDDFKGAFPDELEHHQVAGESGKPRLCDEGARETPPVGHGARAGRECVVEPPCGRALKLLACPAEVGKRREAHNLVSEHPISAAEIAVKVGTVPKRVR